MFNNYCQARSRMLLAHFQKAAFGPPSANDQLGEFEIIWPTQRLLNCHTILTSHHYLYTEAAINYLQIL